VVGWVAKEGRVELGKRWQRLLREAGWERVLEREKQAVKNLFGERISSY
jgi:hypothetical protein